MVAAGVGAAACKMPEQHGVVTSPPGFPGFPTRCTDDALWVEAVLYSDHVARFGTDLTRSGVLPIALRIGTIDAAGDAERPSVVGRAQVLALRPDTLDARLYLQNGTVLAWTPPDDVPASGSVREATATRGLELSLLPSWTDAEEGFLFFRMPSGMRIHDHFALTARHGVYREVDLNHSLLSLSIETVDGPREVRVGVRSEHFAGGSR